MHYTIVLPFILYAVSRAPADQRLFVKTTALTLTHVCDPLQSLDLI